LDAAEDGEQGWPDSVNKGDSLNAFEEYRAFMIDKSGCVEHLRTDPVTQKNVFLQFARSGSRPRHRLAEGSLKNSATPP
jgi:hypothetical protein